MATSGTIQGTTKNSSGSALSYYGTWITWKRNSTNIANSTSNITINVNVQRTDGYSGTTAYNLNDKPTVSLKVGGSAKSPTISYLDTRNLKVCTIATWTGNVTHNTDGTLTLALSCSWTVPNLTYLASGSISGNAVLDTIPRATTPTVSSSSVTMGNSVTITISPADSSFKHKIRYEFGSLASQVNGVKVGGTQITADYISSGTITFTPPTSLGSQIPSANSGTCKFLLYTYKSDGTHIGTNSVNITVSVPTYTPTISNIELTGNNLLSSAYVQGKSTVKVAITASSSYGATIKSYSSTVDGKTYTGSSFTSSALSNGSKTVSVTVTDTRGKTATLSSSAITVYAYANPTITGFTLERQSDGTTVIATVTGSLSAINNKNAKTITVTLNGVTQTITSSSYTISGTTTFTDISTDSTFTATAKITDSYTSVSKDAVLPTVEVTMDFHYSGKGIALGKVAESSDLLDVNWVTRLRKTLTLDGLATLKNHLYLSGHIYMGGNKAATGENHIKFSNPDDSTYPHNLYIYGGSPSSDVAIGLYDAGKSRNVAIYKDGSNAISIGNGSTTINFNGNEMADFVVEQGTSGVWTYRKWNSGIAECWGNVSTTPSTVNGNNAVTVNLPFTFVGTDYKVTITPAKAAMYIDGVGDCATNGSITHTTTSFTTAYKYSYGTAYAVSFNVNVYGKWK